MRKVDSEKTDEELVRLYRADQRLEWLSALFMRYVPMVYGVCLKYLKDRDDAQDAVMQIHERLIASLLAHEVDNFRGWLYVNARNHCLMHLRSSKGRMKEDLSLALMENGQSIHPEEEVFPEGDDTRLEKCLNTLAPPQKQCITLFYLEEKCYKEISVVTGFDHKQVKSYIQNGKRNLKNCLEGNG